ncbi:MAG: hypothetical protein FWB90_06915 [Fibromonadales bacterium]|nr:hypothetical protein [Fibromonadales bacterium]
MIRHFCVLFFAASTLWTAVVTLFLAACSSGGGSIGHEEQRGGSAKLVLGRLQVPLFDSISVHVSAANMENIHISANSVNENLKIDGIPLGENRKFEVKVYADNGKPVLSGEASADISAGQTVTLPISLTPLSGFLRLEIPLGLANSENIHSGTLSLDSLNFQMQIENGKGIFSTGALPLNLAFTLKLELKDPKGSVLFFGEKQIKLSALQQTETMQLQSNRGSAVLELEASSIEPLQILAILPKSQTRTPQYYGDLFFTEIYADPKTNGEPFEYMEVYNATLDTLELGLCQISQLKMPEGLILPPMEFLFFGQDSVENTDFKYKGLNLTNTGFKISFSCGNQVIDSLSTTKNADNPFPISRGKAMQLPLSNFKNRDKGSSWCFGFSPKQDAYCP